MRAQKERLEDAVAGWHQDAEPPVSLRARVLHDGASTPPITRYSAPVASRRRVWWATGAAVALSGAAATVFVAVSTPARPAYADVERAMAQVKTVQWETLSSEFEPRTGKVFRYTSRSAARLDPPAVRTQFGESFDVEAPLWSVSQARNKRGKVVRRRQPSDKAHFVWFSESRNPTQRLRERILRKFLPPSLTGPKNPNETVATEVIEDGRRLLRFDGTLGKRRSPGRLTRPGYRSTVWVDPETRLAIRTQQEYYDGTKHSITVNKSFRYDVSLPDTLFDTSQ